MTHETPPPGDPAAVPPQQDPAVVAAPGVSPPGVSPQHHPAAVPLPHYPPLVSRSQYPAAVPAAQYPAAGSPSQYPAGLPPQQPPAVVPPPPREAWLAPRRVEAVPGTNFAVVHLDVPPVTSGLAVGSLVTGIGSILVSLVVLCFGVAGAQAGWGAWVAGAFAMIAVLAGGAGVALGVLAMRQIRRGSPPPAIRFTGRGLAIAGLVCGAVGLGLTVLGFGLALLIQLST